MTYLAAAPPREEVELRGRRAPVPAATIPRGRLRGYRTRSFRHPRLLQPPCDLLRIEADVVAPFEERYPTLSNQPADVSDGHAEDFGHRMYIEETSKRHRIGVVTSPGMDTKASRVSGLLLNDLHGPKMRHHYRECATGGWELGARALGRRPFRRARLRYEWPPDVASLV